MAKKGKSAAQVERARQKTMNKLARYLPRVPQETRLR